MSEGEASGTTEAAAPWFSAAGEETRGFMEARGYDKIEDPAQAALQAIEGHRNVEKLIGADKAGRTVVLPKEGATEDERAEFYARLGRPKEPGGYELDGFEEAVAGESEWLRNTLHQNGVTAEQAKGIVSALAEYRGSLAKEMDASEVESQREQMAALESEWGGAFDKHVAVGRQAVQFLGWDEAKLAKLEDAMGTAETLRVMHELGSRLSEDSYVGAGANRFGDAMSPAAAKAEIEQLSADRDFGRRLMDGDSEANSKWNRLNQYAYGTGN